MSPRLGPGHGQATNDLETAVVVWLGLCAVASHRLVVQAFPRLRDAVWLGVAVAYGNPMLLACAMSVQNDVPALALALWGLDHARKQKPVAAGLLVGLACLTKLPAVTVLAGVAILLARRREWRPVLTATAMAVAVPGWWLIRNWLTYGDLTGKRAVEAVGTVFPPLGWHGVGTLAHLAQSALVFLWIPVEYLRNTIRAPLPVTVAILTVTALAGPSWLFRS
jgi:hypothetical protein